VALAFLAALALLLVLGLTPLPKKFDRYALPAFPALDILAAAGLVWLTEGIGTRYTKLATLRAGRRRSAAWGLAAAALAGNLAWYHPYELAYYNPLLGGGRVAQRAIPVGWGEGYERAGAFIARQYDACERPVAVWYRVLVERFTCQNLIPMRDFEAGEETGYVILYIDQIQRGYYPGATARLYGVEQPAATIRVHGIDYAQVYQLPPPVSHPLHAVFGGAVVLEGYTVDTTGWQTRHVLELTLRWRAAERMSDDYMLFAHLLDPSGNRVAQVDVRAGDPRAPTSAWRDPIHITQRQIIPLPPTLRPGMYALDLGLYDPFDMQRLAVWTAASAPERTTVRINLVLAE
jgi:hypothetical protein